MKFGATFKKVVAMRKTDRPEDHRKPDKENGQTPQRDGVVKLSSGRDVHHDKHHQTFPASNPSRGLPSHSKTAPSNIADEHAASPDRTPMKVDIPIKPVKRAPTVELVENKAYRPLGGPDYIKILAKYNLFGQDQYHGRVVCRFVNTGNVVNRQPQIVKVEEYSSEQGNQEFLASVTIGNSNPPQGTPAIRRNDSYFSVTTRSGHRFVRLLGLLIFVEAGGYQQSYSKARHLRPRQIENMALAEYKVESSSFLATGAIGVGGGVRRRILGCRYRRVR
jgi:hypothetical protein